MSDRNYSRDDVDYSTWYSPWMRALARDYPRAEIERRLGVNARDAASATASHLRAIERTTSMQSQSQARAQSGNVAAAGGAEAIALRGALEIYELFPEHTYEGVSER